MSFFKAIRKNNLILVKKLIERGADVNQVDEHGYTALMYASRKGHSQIVKYLVEDAGANWFGHSYNKDLELLRK